jgi:hypothetical protein
MFEVVRLPLHFHAQVPALPVAFGTQVAPAEEGATQGSSQESKTIGQLAFCQSVKVDETASAQSP